MQRRGRRPRLTRERVLQTALAILDREGVDALAMRRIAEAASTERREAA